MKDIKRGALTLLEMLMGNALTAAAFGMMIIPRGFAAGGTTGFSRILTRVLPLPLSAVVLAVNLSLLLLGLIFVGRAFAMKTVGMSVLFPLLLELFSRIPLKLFAGSLPLSVITAGILLGTGAGLVLRSGASSGGFDILAVILNKKFGISIALLINLFDSAVIFAQALGQPISGTLSGAAVIAISSFIVGRIVIYGRETGKDSKKVLYNITKNSASACLNAEKTV